MIDRISMTCFGASYLVALALELAQLVRPRTLLRLLGLGFGAAGLLAQTLYIGNRFFLRGEGPPLSSPAGSMHFLAWILAVFYLYGSVHHRRQAWGIFVLPVVLGLTGLARAFAERRGGSWLPEVGLLPEQAWGAVHGVLLLLAAVGVCVGFVASLMYLAQARRLRAKVPPGEGLRLMSLERLEAMNRRAITLAFPLLTAGVLVGLGLMVQESSRPHEWTALKVASTCVLWGVFALLLYLRYGVHLRGRPLALLTIVAFVLLLVTLAFSHTFVQGGGG
jgi:ABC-type transport system involved in cytochrome c biogenesis permease subunit